MNPAIVAKRRRLVAERFLAGPMAAFLAAMDSGDAEAIEACTWRLGEAFTDFEQHVDRHNYHRLQSPNSKV